MRSSALTLQAINALGLIPPAPVTQSRTRNSATPTNKPGIPRFSAKPYPLKTLSNFFFH